MRFEDEYTNTDIMTQPSERDKIPLTPDAYVQGKMMQKLIDAVMMLVTK